MNFHLVLVHGTGARGADWTKPKSRLCRYLKQALGGDQVSFSSPEWPGQNTYQARVDGARILRDEVPRDTGDGHVTILVGHSHGGSVIAHALAADEDLCKRVGGVIFLATPFVHARPLPLGKHLPKGPALLTGLLCALIVVLGGLLLLARTEWPENTNRVLDAASLGVVFTGLFAGWATFRGACRFLGVTDAQLAVLADQVDLGTLETHGLNLKTLIIRSTADEAASGLAAAQLLGRLASDVPALVWKLPQWGWESLMRRSGFDRSEPARWIVWCFVLVILAWVVGFFIWGAAWLTEWPALQWANGRIQEGGSSIIRAGLTAWVWLVNGVILFLLLTVPLIVIGIPVKLFGLYLYGLRGWPVLHALFVELSVEPAPPGEWRIHQLDSRHYESTVDRAREHPQDRDAESGAQNETTLAHSLVCDDPRAHRAIADWLIRAQH